MFQVPGKPDLKSQNSASGSCSLYHAMISQLPGTGFMHGDSDGGGGYGGFQAHTKEP